MIKIKTKIMNRCNGLLMMLFLLFSNFCFTQLVTSTANTPQQLVQNVLIGNGVSVSNIVYTGSANAIGFFNGTNCNVGLDSGIVMTTGTVLSVNGPHGPNNTSGSGMDNGALGDPLLAALGGAQSFNAARLEFDFTAQSDSIKFNFVFGSEEYPEFVGQNVNDAFGFFISGNNPNGGIFSNENIALIPGTTTPVSINTVNPNTNNAYYISNGNGSSSPQNSSNQYVQYDGLTTVLTAKSAVVCGDTYHIIILISDIGDSSFDSGVFLEAGSFSSPGLNISSDLSYQGNIGNDSTLFEGCGGTDLWFVRNDSIPFSQSMPIIVSGSATSGIDCSAIPSSLSFLSGQDSVSIHIDAFDDALAEGLESLTLTIQIPSNCSSTITDSITIYIENVDPISIHLENDTLNCGDSITITPIITGGKSGYSYSWNTGEQTQQITVSPGTTTTYYLEVIDTCGHTTLDSVLIFVPTLSPLEIHTSNDSTINCKNETIQLFATTSGGGSGHTVTWNSGHTGDTIQVTITQTSTFIATVIDDCGNTNHDTVVITLNEIPILSNIKGDTVICKGDSTKLTAIPSGGTGNDYTFVWNTGEIDSSITVAPKQSKLYIVGIGDECGYTKVWDSLFVEVNYIEVNFDVTGLFEEQSIIQFTNLTKNSTSYFWDFGNGMSSELENPTTTYEASHNYRVTLFATNDLGCEDSLTKIVKINPPFYFYAPNAFTPNGDGLNQNWKIEIQGIDIYSFETLIYNRWGEIVFESHNPYAGWDGKIDGQNAASGVYIWKTRVSLDNNTDSRREFIGMITLLR